MPKKKISSLIILTLSLSFFSCTTVNSVSQTSTKATSSEIIQTANARRAEITKDLISLMESDKELKGLVEKSIRLAGLTNPDKKN